MNDVKDGDCSKSDVDTVNGLFASRLCEEQIKNDNRDWASRIDSLDNEGSLQSRHSLLLRSKRF